MNGQFPHIMEYSANCKRKSAMELIKLTEIAFHYAFIIFSKDTNIIIHIYTYSEILDFIYVQNLYSFITIVHKIIIIHI